MVNWYGSILVLHLEYMVPLEWLNHAPLYPIVNNLALDQN